MTEAVRKSTLSLSAAEDQMLALVKQVIVLVNTLAKQLIVTICTKIEQINDIFPILFFATNFKVLDDKFRAEKNLN